MNLGLFMSVSFFYNRISAGIGAGGYLLPSTLPETAWIGSSLAVLAGFGSAGAVVRAVAGVTCLGYLNHKNYQASVFSGFSKYSFIDGSCYEGDVVNGRAHGSGKLTLPNGDVYEGIFVNGRGSGQGKYIWASGAFYEGVCLEGKRAGQGKETLANGSSYEGDFFNNAMISSDISHLGDRLFFDFACRLSDEGAPRGYCLGIMSDYLQKKGYKTLADALSSAHRLLRVPPEEMGKKSEMIRNALKEGASQLFEWGYEGHAMGLNLVPDLASGFVTCEIFNSGGGLSKYHEKHETDFRKYKTMLRIRVPMENLTPDKIQAFLSPDNFKNADDAYRAILDLPGAEMILSDLMPWQTFQKAGECNFRWILAYLKNKMPEEEYKKMLAELRFDSEAAYKLRNPDDESGKDLSWRRNKKIFPDGSVYEGDYIYGKFHGKGKLTFPSGSSYEGNFVSGNCHGKGKLIFGDKWTYEGDFIDGKFHGKGKVSYSNGSFYEGDFVDGEYHGKGKVCYSNGGMYEGDFVNGKSHGWGTHTFDNGNVYEGNFIDGMPHGRGKVTSVRGGGYEGEFVNGKRHGRGKLIFANRDVYEGDFINDKFQGHGKMTFADGSFFEGDYFKGQPVRNRNVLQLINRLVFKIFNK